MNEIDTFTIKDENIESIFELSKSKQEDNYFYLEISNNGYNEPDVLVFASKRDIQNLIIYLQEKIK